VTGETFLGWAIQASLVMLTVALLATFLRLVRGPSLPDRVVALDLIAVLAIGIFAVTAIATEVSALIDAAIVLGLIVFLGTVFFAQYLVRRGLP
jgi:multicomponent Na+:H+ antiporter subunit F